MVENDVLIPADSSYFAIMSAFQIKVPGIGSLSVKAIQFIIWLLVFSLFFLFYLAEYEDGIKALIYTSLNLSFYAIIILINAYYLLPRLYHRGHKIIYIVFALLLVISSTLGWAYSANRVYGLLSSEGGYQLRYFHFIYHGLSVFLIFLFSILLRFALDYFTLHRKQAALEARHSHMELELLKAQVQPHFLFNTLNNIYYVAQAESPATAVLIEKLSGMMRYFVDESPNKYVPLSTEISFLKNYIDLENVRMLYPAKVTFDLHLNDKSISIPPMLLIPFVENIFKHGVVKRSRKNWATIFIAIEEGRLIYEVRNSLEPREPGGNKGAGLRNLKERLCLLYNTNFEMLAEKQNDTFIARLTIPLS